ncbi:membrane protein [Porphyromonas crevioricanis]|uniref:Membrane protein n=2 Tax=Porphyromonas crevioricanis TaxID=393921 RepID=A0A0A2G3P1_9PORP|nr:spore maturation protein [Porphyromonas crevioricanis]KGN89189.1 membrane protein [Porphyromonas crevioricanis]KGN96970.1 membrane protein [Porphyromonas crevioricanis]SJZ99811.1 Spore maturation protein SpmA [Porphyromonas crevioricanis]SQH72449.1 Spore maturation protein A [Porphyromonas crevioricanis]GAD05196.1 fused spore maturation proteins A and B [Porphyromonas crevioricanis JCM 15906]
MLLNYIFIAFFLLAFAFGLLEVVLSGEWNVFSTMVDATFVQAKNGFEIALYLTGVLALWLGLMRIAERAGLIDKLAKASAPVLGCLFPSVPKGHPVMGNIFMNISANILGLDNAATPLGIEAMEKLQTLNKRKEEISDAMIMFLALNASGLTLIPTSIMAFRMQAGAANPTDIFIPILIATAASTLTAIWVIGLKQRINLFQRPLLLLYLVMVTLAALVLFAWKYFSQEQFAQISSAVSSLLLFSIITLFIFSGWKARINVYEAFIDGAKEGFHTAVGIIPYLVAILVAIGVFRASGAMDYLSEGIRWLAEVLGWDTRFVDGLPTILMKPLSGSGARGLMVDAMQTYGADSFVGRLCCTVQGCSDTTFYVVAVYLGAVGIKKSRYVLGASLFADLIGAIVAILVTYLFFASVN